MSPQTHSLKTWSLALLVFASMLTSTMLIPAVRPFMAAFHPGHEWAMHAFMSVNMLGAALGAPLLSLVADRTGGRRRMAAILALLDGLLLLACTLPMPVGLLMVVRTLQGAANVGALSILMAAAGRSETGTVGLMGSAVIAAVAAGAPLGVFLMAMGPAVPLQAGAVLADLVAPVAWLLLPRTDVVRAPRGSMRALLKDEPLLRVPVAWLTAERFTVGCFVVTFSLHAHHVLQLDDARVGVLYSWFLLPFAVLTWPVGKLASVVDRSWLMMGGGLVYGVAFMLLGHVPSELLPVVLCLAGAASAAIYASALLMGAQLAPATLQATTMGVLNAGGTLGMMAGTAGAGMASGMLKAAGFAREEVYPWIFTAAGAVQLLLLLWTLLPGRRQRLRASGGAAPVLPAPHHL